MDAIEENGVSYHHPFLIKKKKYKVILNKQNAVIHTNGIVYRWDTESIRNTCKIVDEIREFIGDINQYLFQYHLHEDRVFSFYEHQDKYIARLKSFNENDAALVVLPTGSGKTVIATETLKHFYATSIHQNTLILVPGLDLKRQWEKELIQTFGITYHLDVRHVKKLDESIFKKMTYPSKYVLILISK